MHRAAPEKRTTIFAAILLAHLAFPAMHAVAQQIDDIPVPTPRPERPIPAAPVSVEPAPPARTETQEARAEKSDFVHRAACPALRSGRVEGVLAAPERDGDCGEDSPLELHKASGVTLTGKPLSNCAMAEGLAFIGEAAKTAAKVYLETELEAIVTGPGYECRRRNRASSGKLSEHAFANALDIAGFRLVDGRQITVEGDWPHLPPAEPSSEVSDEQGAETSERSGEGADDQPPSAGERAETPEAKFLVAVRDAACTVFTTVLSPDTNAAHRSHMHFDLGCHGKTCTYLICE